AILFPGQGTQKVGMAAKLLENKTAAAMFEMASKVLGYDLVGLCAQGPQEKLDSTLYSQPAIFVCSLAAMEKAKKEAPEMLKKVKVAAGFSLGEYSALVFAGALT
ncbi:putative S-malonyltransferase, partial [Emiliania huxleyi CCMP1516]